MKLKEIVNNKIPCLFLSPHLDDAILSAGGLISYLKDKTQIKVITVFTEADSGPQSMSVKSFIRQCGYKTADQLYSDRRNEDINLFQKRKIPIKHLGKIDALWRKIPNPSFIRQKLSILLPEFLYIYPVYRLHIVSGKLSRFDDQLKHELMNYIQASVKSSPNLKIFVPLGIGKNVDHILVREAARETHPDQTVYWSDFPYSEKFEPDYNFITTNNLDFENWDTNLDKKIEMIKEYYTQVNALFKDGIIPREPEIFYSKVS